jgi:hypothetical protein
MSVRRLPERPNLDQIKHQAKELLAAWRSGASAEPPPSATAATARCATNHCPAIWFRLVDALRLHVESIAGASDRASERRPACSSTMIRSRTRSS